MEACYNHKLSVLKSMNCWYCAIQIIRDTLGGEGVVQLVTNTTWGEGCWEKCHMTTFIGRFIVKG
jgi:hypothetical protein